MLNIYEYIKYKYILNIYFCHIIYKSSYTYIHIYENRNLF